jgi:steroid delta-isomerase-like uncharacterized protein
MLNRTTPGEVVRAFVEAVNRRDWQALETLVAPDFARRSMAAGAPVSSRQELIQFLHAEYATFPDGKEEIAELVAESDKVAVRMRFRGTQFGPMGSYPPTGRSVESEYLAIYRIEAGVIVEAWAEWDNLSTLRQLGHLP